MLEEFTIDLVYPASATNSENYSSEPPLGPLALYSSLPEQWRLQVSFLDSTIMPQSKIYREIEKRKTNVVAISCTTFNYANAIRVAEIAKNNNSWVVLGGIHITHLRDRILTKMKKGERPLDFLVTGFGEPAFHSLLNSLANGNSFTGIPSLSFIDKGQIVVNECAHYPKEQDPLEDSINYNLVDLKKYNENFQRFGNLKSTGIVASIFTQRGCSYAGKRRCLFCSIERNNNRRPKHLIEEDLITLIKEHNVEHIRINDADFTKDINHMRRVADASENISNKMNFKPSFYCFARSDEIDESRIEVLKRINVVSVFLGYESGSNDMLKVVQKNTTVEQHLHATRLLKRNGIDVICASFVLGAIGEGEKTLQETLRFVYKLKAIDNVRTLAATPLIPLPGSLAFTLLLNLLAKEDSGKYQELNTADDFDIPELVELWNRYMCNVSLPRIIQVIDEIASLFKIGIRFHKFS